MAKQTLVAKTSVGDFTRVTDSKYTHVVVWNSPRAVAAAARIASEGRSPSGVETRWAKDNGFAVTWHGSESAAQNATKGYGYDSKATLVGVFAV